MRLGSTVDTRYTDLMSTPRPDVSEYRAVVSNQPRPDIATHVVIDQGTAIAWTWNERDAKIVARYFQSKYKDEWQHLVVVRPLGEEVDL